VVGRHVGEESDASPTPAGVPFRRRAVELANQRDENGHRLQPVAKTAEDLGISDSCLRNWIAQADVESGQPEGLTAAGRKEPVALRRRTRVLETENEMLKRAAAYLARDNVLPK
jgi:transposase